MAKFTILTISSKNFEETTVTGGHRRYAELVRCLIHAENTLHLIGPSKIPRAALQGYFLKTPSKRFSSNLLPNSFSNCFAVMWTTLRNLRKLRKARIDAIIVLSLANGLPAVLLGTLLKCKVVTWIVSDPEECREIQIGQEGIKLFPHFSMHCRFLSKIYLRAFSMFEKSVLRHSDFIMVQSNLNKKLLSARLGIQESKFRVLGNNLNPAWVDPSLYNSNKSKRLERICFVGGLVKRKGVVELINSFIKLAREFPHIRLDIVGKGPELPKLERIVSEAKLEGRVVFHGWVTNPLKILADSDLMILPTYSDSFPEVIGESLYVGTPVLGSRVGGIPEQLEYDELLFEARSKKAIIDKLRPILSDNTIYLKVRDLCAQRAKSLTFDWGRRFQELLEEVLNEEP
jgi:glycosyltransferase involved in cell wall biosynthesis